MALRADLHLHSCLSPCSVLEMSPSAIAQEGRRRGIDVLALTDHNSARNCPAFRDACRSQGVTPLFGVEACSREEVHLLCLFDTVEQAQSMGGWLESRLVPAARAANHDEDLQVVVNANDEVLTCVRPWLAGATDAGIDEIARRAAGEGMVIPAHIDRPAFGIIAQLGFLPRGPFAAVEISATCCRARGTELAAGYPLVRGSDAHHPDDIGRATTVFEIATVSIAALKEALARGRAHVP